MGGRGEPSGVRRLDLWIAVDLAVKRADLAQVDAYALAWLVFVEVGELRRLPRSEKLGARSRAPQYARVRRLVRDAIVDGSLVRGLAHEHGVGADRMAKVLGRARGLLEAQLRASDLMPAAEKRRREREPRSARPVDDTFGGWNEG